MTHKELTKIREDKKLTKGQFAALIGISAMMQGRYESGKIAIPDHIAKKVLALGAAKVAKDVAADKTEGLVKEVGKATAKKVVKEAEKKVVKDAEKKIAKKAVKAAAGVAAVEGAKKAAGEVQKKASEAKKADAAKKAEDTKKANAAKKAEDTKKAEKTKPAGTGKKKDTVLYIESQLGGRITTEEILKRIPAGVDEVYVKPEENKAYWVKGKKTGDVDLW